MSARIVWGSGVCLALKGASEANREDIERAWPHLVSDGLATDDDGLNDDAWICVSALSEGELDLLREVRGHLSPRPSLMTATLYRRLVDLPTGLLAALWDGRIKADASHASRSRRDMRVTLDDDVLTWIDAEAERRGDSRSAVVQDALRKAMNVDQR